MCGRQLRKRNTATALCACPFLKRLARFPLLPCRRRSVAEPQLPLRPGPRPWIWWPGERWLAGCCLFVRSERQIVCLRPAVRRCRGGGKDAGGQLAVHMCMPLLGGLRLWVALMDRAVLHVPSCVLPLERVLVGWGVGGRAWGSLARDGTAAANPGRSGFVDVAPRCFATVLLLLLLPAHTALSHRGFELTRCRVSQLVAGPWRRPRAWSAAGAVAVRRGASAQSALPQPAALYPGSKQARGPWGSVCTQAAAWQEPSTSQQPRQGSQPARAEQRQGSRRQQRGSPNQSRPGARDCRPHMRLACPAV